MASTAAHTHDPVTALTSPPSGASTIRSQDASPFLRLPTELQVAILKCCSFRDLKRLQATCKAIKALLDADAFAGALFRPTAHALTRKELISYYQRHMGDTGQAPAGCVRMHPCILNASSSYDHEIAYGHSPCCVPHAWMRHFDGTTVGDECATSPPVRKATVVLQSRTAWRSVDDTLQHTPVRVKHIMKTMAKLQKKWKAMYCSALDRYEAKLYGYDMDELWGDGPVPALSSNGTLRIVVTADELYGTDEEGNSYDEECFGDDDDCYWGEG
ncbi:hypothetical protein OC842_006204 [Tilletia horrida]|uniref:F-box domain-containing protein n=1 Tax=Tilletia horrida TaxID=155126 RepID=A0AAN6G8X7_9BASI|nr:hypothetical protein OC842_006204 [Tilletia horrida]